jgi:predicted transcriptional regulator
MKYSLIISLLLTISLFAKEARPKASKYDAIVQEYKDPNKDIVSKKIRVVTMEIEENGDLVTVAPAKRIVLSWNEATKSWSWKPNKSLKTTATWKMVGKYIVIDYLAYEDGNLVGKARFYMIEK